MFKGIDVSVHQGKIDWNKLKRIIDFAILRCGFGNDIAKQDDVQFATNITKCKDLGIPYAVYLYSYATTEAMIDSEIAHALRLIGDNKPFCVYIDMEDSSTVSLGKSRLTAFAKRFCEGVKAKGFKVGVYANYNWFTNYLDVAELHKSGYSIWCAKYSDNKPNIAAPYDIWQYSSKGKVDGINGNVDMNYMYNDIRNYVTDTNVNNKKTVTELAKEVMAGLHGIGHENRKASLLKQGYDNYEEVRAKVNELYGVKTSSAPKVKYFKKYSGESTSIVSALKSIGETSSFDYRGKIAKANNIKAYVGTAKQNTTMLNLLKNGKLIKP